MTHRVVWEDIDGSIKVTIPSPEFLKKNPNFDLTQMKGVPAHAVNKAVVEEVDVPSDRTFRNAWKWDGRLKSKCGVDLAKAKHLAADKVREARKPVMENLDAQYMQADEAGNPSEKTAIANKKQTARDATTDSRIVNATTVAELKTGMDQVIAYVQALAV